MDYSIAKYMIPLDDLDISLLSLENAVHKKTEHQPLWSRANTDLKDKKIYYSFEESDDLDETDTNDDYTDSSSDNVDVILNTCICHICNIEVPEIFMKDHINSSKHKMYLQIATTALRRVNRSLNQNICISNPIKSIYFCNVCVSAVDNRSRHFLSSSHRIAVKRDKMFKSLVQLYIDEDINSDIDCEDSSTECDTYNKLNKTVNVKKSTENERRDEIDISKFYNNGEEKNLYREECLDDDFKVSLHKINQPAGIKDKQISFTIKEQELSEDHVRILNTGTVASHVLKLLDLENYIIQTKDGFQIKVQRNNYHSFKKIGKRKYECQLCSSICQRKGTHILSEKHMKKISSPIKDKHCVREVDSTSTHCILCNMLIESYLLHTVCSESHAERLKNSIIIPEDDFENSMAVANKSTKTPKDNIVEVDKKQAKENTISDYYGNKNELKEARGSDFNAVSKVSNLNLPANFLTSKLEASGSDVAKDEKLRIKVPVANDSVPNLNIEEQKENTVPTIENIGSQSKHKNGMSSQSSVVETTSINHPYSFLIETTSNVENLGKMCKVCRVQIPNTSRNVIEHLNGSKHNQIVSDLLKVNGLKMTNDKFYCEFCYTYMTIGSQFAHLNLKSHEEKVKKSVTEIEVAMKAVETISLNENIEKANIKSTEITKPLVNKIVTPAKEVETNTPTTSNVSIDKSPVSINPYVMEITSERKEILCKICKVIVPLKECNIKEHINGIKHINNESELLVKNKITTIDSRIYCKLCRIYINIGMHLAHIDTFFHKIKINVFESQSNKENYTKNALTISNMNWWRMIVTHVIEVTPKGNEIICKICKVIVSHKECDINEHLNGRKHRNTEAGILEKNKITNVDLHVYCQLCCVSIINEKHYAHIESLSHKANMVKQLSEIKVTAGTIGIETKFGNVKEIPNKPSASQTDSVNNKYYGMVHSKPNVMRCTICEVDVPESIHTLNMHVKGTKHVNKLNK